MKRIFFAAALAAIAGSSAFAQSSVTIYGRLNVTAEFEQVGDGDRIKSIRDNASRLGFLGVEDLGGGLKAGFQIEHRFSADTGMAADTFWVGQSEVNLSSNFGMLRAGQYTKESYYATADYVSLHNHDTGTSADVLYSYIGTDANKISYRTPEIAGFWFEASAAEGVDYTPGHPERTFDYALNWTAGALHVGAGYTDFGPDFQFALSALYEFGNFTFGGYYQRSDLADADRDAFRLSGRYTLGASEFHLNYGQADDLGDTGNTAANQVTLGYNYNLSKRTKVYGYYTRIDNDSGVGYGTGVLGANYNSYALGIRHNF